ncbi:MAG: hypothetical protein RL748_2702, partial [Pseudomonadota bacterium]
QERTSLATNQDMVARMRLQAAAMDRPIASAQRVRQMLGLAAAPGA